MSRYSSAAPQQRGLSALEELEKIEQSITLTLQEIDHNFSRAHQAVTQTILPVVEQYAKHSEAVWEGSKFWKHFFEASANVSLNGYEETPTEADTTTTAPTDASALTEDGADASQATYSSSSYVSPPQAHDGIDLSTPRPRAAADETDLSSTPRPARAGKPRLRSPPPRPEHTRTAPYDSPYEALRREMLPGSADTSATDPDASVASAGPPGSEPGSTLPSTPRAQTRPDSPAASDATPDSASALPDSPALALPTAAAARRPPHSAARDPAVPNPDVLLHRVLDRNYRLQATPRGPQTRLPRPHESRPTPVTGRRAGAAGNKAGKAGGATALLDLDSSPLGEAPQLRSELLETPGRRQKADAAREAQGRARVPGVSVLTPAKPPVRHFALDEEDDDDDDDEGLPAGMSPPKTMQFHIPQSRLLKTPAREASKRIVEDLLLTAGGTFASDDEGSGAPQPPDSPSIIGRRALLEEDTF